MPIKMKCSQCEKRLSVQDRLAGKRIKCPACAKVQTVPQPPEEPTEPSAPGAMIRSVSFVPGGYVGRTIRTYIAGKLTVKLVGGDAIDFDLPMDYTKKTVDELTKIIGMQLLVHHNAALSKAGSTKLRQELSEVQQTMAAYDYVNSRSFF